MEQDLVRISKLLSARGICSRREADRYIQDGLVLVNGKPVTELGTKVHPDAELELHDDAKVLQNEKATIILNKPLGYVSMPGDKEYPVAADLLTEDRLAEESSKFSPDHVVNLGIAGRLDVDSKGLLILSQNGTLIKHIIGPDARLEKEYLVRVDQDVTPEMISRLRHGIFLDGDALRRADVDLLKPKFLRIVLTQGKKRQIRRMCEAVGLEVIKLKRVRIGKLRLAELPEGQWRYLRPGEAV